MHATLFKMQLLSTPAHPAPSTAFATTSTRCDKPASSHAIHTRSRFTQMLQPLTTKRAELQIARAKTASMDLEIGMKAPEFTLLEPLTGRQVSLIDFEGAPALLVVIMCNHCPFVKLLKESLAELAREYQAKGVAVVAISPNSVMTHPQDGPEEMAKDAKAFNYSFPYLYDETQEIAKAYFAAATPEFYVFDDQQNLRYHGQYDDARPSNGKTVTGKDVRAALNAVLQKQPAPKAPPSIGCNIKWHPGKEPQYFGATAV